VWTDHHCHLPEDPGERARVVEAAHVAGVTRLVDVGTTVADSRRAVERASIADGCFATAGVHPHDARDGVAGLRELAGRREVRAIGECGLDYHYLHSPAEVQREVFAAQVALAHELDLALVIHSREAWEDTFDVLDACGVPERTIFHCFTGGPDEARRCLDRGAVLSFSGIVTFPSAPEVREAAALCPADRYLVETDAPYLTPVPHRGRRNTPAMVAVVGAAVAAVRGVEPEVVADETTRTADRCYRFSAAAAS